MHFWTNHVQEGRKGAKNMNLDDVKNYLEENKEQTEVKEYLNGLKTVSTDDVKGFWIQKKVNVLSNQT